MIFRDYANLSKIDWCSVEQNGTMTIKAATVNTTKPTWELAGDPLHLTQPLTWIAIAAAEKDLNSFGVRRIQIAAPACV